MKVDQDEVMLLPHRKAALIEGFFLLCKNPFGEGRVAVAMRGDELKAYEHVFTFTDLAGSKLGALRKGNNLFFYFGWPSLVSKIRKEIAGLSGYNPVSKNFLGVVNSPVDLSEAGNVLPDASEASKLVVDKGRVLGVYAGTARGVQGEVEELSIERAGSIRGMPVYNQHFGVPLPQEEQQLVLEELGQHKLFLALFGKKRGK